MARKVAVIGAGASGLGVARALRRAGIDFEILEQTGRVGGNWQPEGPASKMYRSAHLISSKKNTEFADHPMPKEYPAYPRHDRFHTYLNSVAEKSDLLGHIRERQVAEMKPEPNGWRLFFADGGDGHYDFVVVCNGLLGAPDLPPFAQNAAIENFHAVDYKTPECLRDKRVLIVGGGNSGCDIAVDATQTARSVFHSTRRGYHYMPKFVDGRPTQEWLMEESPKYPDPAAYWDHVARIFKLAGFRGEDFGLPPPDHPIQACHPIMNSQILFHIGHGDISPKVDVGHMDGDRVYFKDGSSEIIDAVVWATGYRVNMPFLSREIFDWRIQLPNLFLRMVPSKFDDLLFVGYLNSPSGIGNLVNTMARFVVNYISANERKDDSWRKMRNIVESNIAIDLGEGRFVNTARHAYEVDLWKFLKSVNFLSTKLDVRRAANSEFAGRELMSV